MNTRMRRSWIAALALLLGPTALPAAAAPELASSTFLGGRTTDFGEDVARDGAGNVYVVATTESKDFPTTRRAFDRKLDGPADAAVSKFDAAGALLWSTFLGGDGIECSPECSLAVDASGAVYVTGSTSSTDFPTTPGTFDTALDGPRDVFVTKLDPSGGSLVYSTFLGGSGLDSESPLGLVVDGANAAYVTGAAGSTDFPTTTGAFDTTHSGTSDAFVTKLDPSGGWLVFSTFLGDTGAETGFGIAVDGTGVYVGGLTGSAGFPTTAGAFDVTHNGGQDAFAAKLDPTGSSLVYGTFVGGSLSDAALDLGIDAAGAAYLTGQTQSPDFPTTAGSFDTTLGGDADGFVTKLGPSGSTAEYSTFLGGTQGESARGIAVDGGDAVVTGATGSADFPTTADALDVTLGGIQDAFVSRLDAAGTTLSFSTYLGGSNADNGASVAGTWVVGSTQSEDFPTTPDAFDTRFNSKGLAFDAFLAEVLTQ